MTSFRFALPLLVLSSTAYSAEIVLPATALERAAPVTAIVRINPQATGKATLAVRWTDSAGRIVEDRVIAAELLDENEVTFPLDVRRAVTMQNELMVEFRLEGVNKSGKMDNRQETAQVSFIAKPADRRWWDYQIVMWQQHTPEMFGALKRQFGITAGQYSGRATTPPQFLLSNNLRWYAENIATDFYAEYHRYRRDRKQNWSFLEAKELYKKDPSGKEAFKRYPSLSDPLWLQKIQQRLRGAAEIHSPYRPLFYDLGDESGIADLAAFWDFDFSDHSLGAMRDWLKERYRSLPALNAQWGSQFTSWDRVVPQTTNEAMKRTDNNFSSWSDHKEWMDVAFARALKAGADAINSVDPDAYVSICGAQMPGWGGYDYYRLTNALSALEPYNIGSNVEIIRSINPQTVMVTTAFARGPWEKHRVWYELLHGSRGIIIWDEKAEYVSRDLKTGERGAQTEAYYNELRSGLAASFINSVRQSDPVAIHYSQPSMRIEWMLAQKPKGDAWVERSSATERMDSEFLRLRESWSRLIEDAGLQYNFVASQHIESGDLIRSGYRVLVLPRSTALSAKEAEQIKEFAAQGGVVLADGEPGRFDEHSRQLATPALKELEAAGKMTRVNFNTLDYHQHRLVGKEGPTHTAVQHLLGSAGVTPEFRIADGSGKPPVGIELHRFRNGGITLLGLHTNPQLRVDELGPPEFKSNERFERPQQVTLTLPQSMQVVNLRSGKSLGVQKSITLTVDPYEPTLFALAATEMPELQISAPASGIRGQTVTLGMRFTRPSAADQHVFRVECTGPDGKVVSHYSGNVLAARGTAAHPIPFAMNDAPGRWTIRATDILSGQSKSVTLNVQ